MGRTDSFEKTLLLGKIEGVRRRGWQRMKWLDSMEVNLSKFQELVMNREAWRTAIHGIIKSRTQQSDWTELPDQKLNLGPLHWECSLSHWITREVPCVSLWMIHDDRVFSGCMPSNGIAGSYDNFVFSFLWNLHTFSHSDYTNLHSQQ